MRLKNDQTDISSSTFPKKNIKIMNSSDLEHSIMMTHFLKDFF